MSADRFAEQRYGELLAIARQGYAKHGRGILLAREVITPDGVRQEVRHTPKTDPYYPHPA